MKVHRFYVPEVISGKTYGLTNKELLHQWVRVLRFSQNEHVRLFNGVGYEAEYKISSLSRTEAVLELITELPAKTKPKTRALCWSLLKRDHNDFVLQKGVELGITNFIPVIGDRTEKTGFPIERSQKILIEAVEQSGRSDVPNIVNPITIYELINKHKQDWAFVACEQGGKNLTKMSVDRPIALLLGAEGGWSDRERAMFVSEQIPLCAISPYTLRAETAAVVGAALLSQMLDNQG